MTNVSDLWTFSNSITEGVQPSQNAAYLVVIYRTRAIIARGLYTFYPLFEVKKLFLRGFFLKILAFCVVSIQERFQIKSRL